MRQDELLDALSEIDPEYIVEAEETVVHKKHHWEMKKFIAMAACACLIVGGAYAANSILSSGSVPKGTTDGATSGLDKGFETSDSAIKDSPKEDSSTYMGVINTPEKIYYRDQCYERTESEMQYDMYLLTCLGELGDEDDLLHADTGVQDVKVYLVDQDQLLIEMDEKQMIYKKVE